MSTYLPLEGQEEGGDKQAAPGGEAYHLTPNAMQMVQGADERWARLQMVRNLFTGSYSKLGLAEAAAMRAHIRRKGFKGLDAAACGFDDDFKETASACEALLWAKKKMRPLPFSTCGRLSMEGFRKAQLTTRPGPWVVEDPRVLLRPAKVRYLCFLNLCASL